jgi:hypothetical protein
MLTNPNCEFELNFIPLNTLGQWFQSLRINESQDQIDDDEDSLQITQTYQVNKALDQALIDWLPEFNKFKSAVDTQQILKVIFHCFIVHLNMLFFSLIILHKR